MSKSKKAIRKKAQHERKCLREACLPLELRRFLRSIHRCISSIQQARSNQKKAVRGAKKVARQRRMLLRLSEAQNHRCCYCGTDTWHPNINMGETIIIKSKRTRATLEHVLPRSKGGTYGMYNLVMACNECNIVRGNRPVENFLQSIYAPASRPRKQSSIKVKEISLKKRIKTAKKMRNLFRLLIIAAMCFPDDYKYVIENANNHTYKAVFKGGKKTRTPRVDCLKSIRHRVQENRMAA